MNNNNRQKSNNMENNIETKICKAVSRVLITPYNGSLIVGTLIIWSITGGIFPYSTNQNFDMLTNVSSYIQFLGITATTYGLIRHNSEGAYLTRKMLRLGIITYILSFLTVITMKNFGIIFLIGFYLIKPISIFSFLMLLQAIWKLPTISAENASEITISSKKKKEVTVRKK